MCASGQWIAANIYSRAASIWQPMAGNTAISLPWPTKSSPIELDPRDLVPDEFNGVQDGLQHSLAFGWLWIWVRIHFRVAKHCVVEFHKPRKSDSTPNNQRSWIVTSDVQPEVRNLAYSDDDQRKYRPTPTRWHWCLRRKRFPQHSLTLFPQCWRNLVAQLQNPHLSRFFGLALWCGTLV